MAGHRVLLCVLVSVVIVKGTATASPAQKDTCGPAVSSLLQAVGHLPDCVTSTLDKLTSPLVQEIREIMQESRAPMRLCSKLIIEEGEPRHSRHCQDLLNEGDSGHGVRLVYPYPDSPDEGAAVYCDHTVDGGGWTVFQHRDNLTTREDFYRTWPEYELGFGNLTGEFWLGLNKLYVLTSSSPQQLRVDLSDYDGEQRWAKYSIFKVGPPEDNYRLTVDGYTGDAGDAMIRRHNGQQFTTHDAKHDTHLSLNCAERFKGGWWYKDCYHANPNGYQYEGNHESHDDGINWYQWKGYYPLMKTTFMIKPSI